MNIGKIKTAKERKVFVCEKKYPQRAKYYVYRKILYIPQCTVSNCMGRTTRTFELEQDAVDAWNTRTPKERGGEK